MNAVAVVDRAFAFVEPAMQKLDLEKNQKGAMACVAAGAFVCICLILLGAFSLFFLSFLLEDEKCSQE